MFIELTGLDDDHPALVNMYEILSVFVEDGVTTVCFTNQDRLTVKQTYNEIKNQLVF